MTNPEAKQLEDLIYSAGYIDIFTFLADALRSKHKQIASDIDSVVNELMNEVKLLNGQNRSLGR